MKTWRIGDKATFYQSTFEQTLNKVAELGGCDLICTSPPYCDARTYDNDVSWKLEDYQRLGDHVHKALKPGGHCLMVLDAPVQLHRQVEELYPSRGLPRAGLL